MSMVLDERNLRIKVGDTVIWQAHNIEMTVVGFEDVIVPSKRDEGRRMILQAKVPIPTGIVNMRNIFVVPKDDVVEAPAPTLVKG